MQSPSQNEFTKPFFPTLREVAWYFTRTGFLTFQGSAATMARLRHDLIGSWISQASFEGARRTFERLPTPLIFQMVAWIGFERGSQAGFPRTIAIVASLFYLLPLFIAILGLSHLWTLYGTPDLGLGAQAATLGVLIAAVIKAMRSPQNEDRKSKSEAAWWIFVIFGFLLALLRPSIEIGAITVCGFLSLSPSRLKFKSTTVTVVAAALVGVSIWSVRETLIFSGLKTGALMFGGGLASLPLLGGEFVDQLQWLTHSRFLEFLTLNRFLSAPLMMTMTSIAFFSGGTFSAILATLSVFTVPYLHVITWYARRSGFREFKIWNEFSFGATAAILGAAMASLVKLLEPVVLAGLEVEHIALDRRTVTLALWIAIPAMSYYALRKKQRPAWAVILGGAIVSLLALSWV